LKRQDKKRPSGGDEEEKGEIQVAAPPSKAPEAISALKKLQSERNQRKLVSGSWSFFFFANWRLERVVSDWLC